MSRRLELLVYGLMACVQVLTAYLAFSYFADHEAEPHPAGPAVAPAGELHAAPVSGRS